MHRATDDTAASEQAVGQVRRTLSFQNRLIDSTRRMVLITEQMLKFVLPVVEFEIVRKIRNPYFSRE